MLVEFAVLAAAVQNEITLSGNESSRFATVQSLVEKGTFAIEGSQFPTVDRVKIRGRFYSNKPLLFSVFLSGLYAPLHWIGGLRFSVDRNVLISLLTVLGVVPFSLLLTCLFQRRLCNAGMSCRTALTFGLAAVFTTWIFSYGTSLNNHTPAAAMVFLFLTLLCENPGETGPARALAAGIVAGLLMGIEIPTGGIFFLVGGAALLMARRPVVRPPVIYYVAGFSLVTLALAGLNLAVYGYPLDAYLVPGSFDFAESIHAPGVAGLRRPEHVGSYLFHIALGQRGVWSHMPALCCGVLYLWQRRGRLPLAERLAAGAIIVLFLFYGTRTGIFGGWAYGFRFLIPVIPVIFWWSGLWYLEARRRWQKNVFWFLLLVGLATSWVGSLNPWPVAYEGVATPPQAVAARVRSPFLSNLMVWSFAQNPDGPLFRWLARDVYGRETALEYLWAEFSNRCRPDRLEQVRHLAQKWKP